MDHRKFPVQEEILGTSCGGVHCGTFGGRPLTTAAINYKQGGKGEEEEETATHRRFYPCSLRREWANTGSRFS